MIPAIVELQKIDDVPIRQPIVKIAQRPSQDETQRHLEQSIPYRTPYAIDNNDHRCDRREQRKQNRLTRRTDGRENSEGYSGISYIRNVKKSVYYGDRLIEPEPALNQRLGPSVQEERGKDQN